MMLLPKCARVRQSLVHWRRSFLLIDHLTLPPVHQIRAVGPEEYTAVCHEHVCVYWAMGRRHWGWNKLGVEQIQVSPCCPAPVVIRGFATGPQPIILLVLYVVVSSFYSHLAPPIRKGSLLQILVWCFSSLLSMCLQSPPTESHPPIVVRPTER